MVTQEHAAAPGRQRAPDLAPGAQVDLYRDGFTAANALELAGSYDVVVDATDNAASRYLASDACAVLNRPLVSGAALGTDGQLTVYCCGPDGARTRAYAPANCETQSGALCAVSSVPLHVESLLYMAG